MEGKFEANDLELNAAYGSVAINQEENVYETPRHLESESEEEFHNRDTQKKILIDQKKIGCCTVPVATITALVLASLALLASVGAICFGVLSHQDSQEFNNSKNDIAILQNQLSLLHIENSEQDATLDAIISTLSSRHQGIFWSPVKSCSDLPPWSRSGDYWLQTNETSNPVQVHCNMNPTNCSCDKTGGWMRVTNLDMSDPNQRCPNGLKTLSAPLRTCGRTDWPVKCSSTLFETYGVEYSHVCGKIKAYQYGAPDAFVSYRRNNATSIDSSYLDGISLTHGRSPRQHIWTFAAAIDEVYRQTAESMCSCTLEHAPSPPIRPAPPFVGNDYFCDTAAREHWQIKFYSDDPLWDGHGCGTLSSCCEFNSPPWFCKQLPLPTTDDIELRICGNQPPSDEDTPVEKIEIYVK